MIIKKYLKILLIFCLFFGSKTRVSAAVYTCNCTGLDCSLTGTQTSCTSSTTIGTCAMNGAGTCGSVCGSDSNQCCSSASTYTKYTYKIEITKTRTCNIYGVCTTPVPTCSCAWAYVRSACSTGDKCKLPETFLRAGDCNCNPNLGQYKLCCSNTAGVGPVTCQTLYGDGLDPPEGRCPDGSTTITIPPEQRIGPSQINQTWINSVCPSCTAVSGVCGTATNTCSSGTVTGTGTVTTSTGINNIWSCLGSCGGSNSGTCSSVNCTAVSGVCGTATNTCSSGTVTGTGTVTTSTGINNIWSCLGSCGGSNSGTCSSVNCTKVDGVCGAVAASCAAPTTGLCTGGTASGVTPNASTFSWTCSGSCTGASPGCTSTRSIINGTCGAATGGNYASTPTTDLCGVGTASAVTLSGTTYSWTCNRNCNGTTPTCTATYDPAPTLSSTVLKNTSGTVIAVEAGGRNHSCDANFAGSKTSVWIITAADANGVADIKETSLRFRSVANTYSYGPVAAVNGVASFTIDTTSFTPGTYNVETLINDIHDPPLNRGWLDTNRDFKIWDCEVIVDGTLYDNSENLGCVNGSNQGFDQPIDSGLSFVFDYLDKTDGSTRDMTVVSPDFDSPKTLTWQNTYTLTNNTTANYLGVFNRLKINDVCIVPVNTDILPRSYVDPYSASPTINIKYSAIMDQDAWYQVLNGGVFTKTNITNYIPVTCVSNRKTSLGGLIWSKKVNLSPYDTGTTAIVVLKRPFYYDYEELKYDIYGGKEVGTTIATTETTVLWSQIDTNKGVIFVDRDFTIDSNIDPSEPTLIVVKGDIIIEDNVTQINGMLFADGTIQASGENDTQLTITGALYSKGGVVLDRSYATKRTNNTLPAVKIIYDPNLVFNLDPELWYEYNNWTLE